MADREIVAGNRRFGEGSYLAQDSMRALYDVRLPYSDYGIAYRADNDHLEVKERRHLLGRPHAKGALFALVVRGRERGVWATSLKHRLQEWHRSSEMRWRSTRIASEVRALN